MIEEGETHMLAKNQSVGAYQHVGEYSLVQGSTCVCSGLSQKDVAEIQTPGTALTLGVVIFIYLLTFCWGSWR